MVIIPTSSKKRTIFHTLCSAVSMLNICIANFVVVGIFAINLECEFVTFTVQHLRPVVFTISSD